MTPYHLRSLIILPNSWFCQFLNCIPLFCDFRRNKWIFLFSEMKFVLNLTMEEINEEIRMRRLTYIFNLLTQMEYAEHLNDSTQ